MFLLTLILVVILFAFLSMAFILLTARGSEKPKNLDVEINGSKVSFIQDESGTHIKLDNLPQNDRGEVVRNADGMRPRDFDILPDLVNDTPLPDGGPDLIFWEKLYKLDSLEPEERREIINKLLVFGFVRADEASNIMRQDEGASGFSGLSEKARIVEEMKAGKKDPSGKGGDASGKEGEKPETDTDERGGTEKKEGGKDSGTAESGKEEEEKKKEKERGKAEEVNAEDPVDGNPSAGEGGDSSGDEFPDPSRAGFNGGDDDGGDAEFAGADRMIGNEFSSDFPEDED